MYIDVKGLRLDSFCPSCGESSVFKYVAKTKLLPHQPIIGHRVGPRVDRIWQFLVKVLGYVDLHCAREYSHTFEVIFKLTGSSEHGYDFTKIGQLPSKLDLVSKGIRKYQKLAPNDAKELHSAAICTSSGFHVAAFVYLRRVFERRLEIAHDAAKSDTGWDESTYDPQMRMADRIKSLQNHLPEFLVTNRKIYSILSKGIHELTEEECRDAFSTMEVGITLILDEELEKKAREAKLASVENDLAKLHEKHK